MSDTSTSVTITIPVQIDRRATPNGRAHWGTKRRIVDDLHGAAVQACQGADLHLGHSLTPPLVLHWLIAHGKGRKRLDDDNAISAMKPLRDGIAAVLGIDDKLMITGSMTQVRDDAGLGYVKVVIEETT